MVAANTKYFNIAYWIGTWYLRKIDNTLASHEYHLVPVANERTILSSVPAETAVLIIQMGYFLS